MTFDFLTNEATPTNRDFVRGKINELRKRLLDLTARNPLLNFRHPTGCVRVVDEVPDQVASRLGSSKGFSFAPVPRPTLEKLRAAGFTKHDPVTQEERVTEPSADVWAKHLGIATGFELPKSEEGSAHSDDKLQTLLFPEALEPRLRAIQSKAQTAVNEMGCNVLFLAVGFLEWYESDASDVKRLAPLYTVSVDIAKDKLNADDGAFRYKITPRDEDVLTNVTLREKLAADFALALPPVDVGCTPEEYFKKVEDGICDHQPRWKVHRYITLAVLNFQKQAMYEDLDPARWPNQELLDHEVVRAFFTSEEKTAEAVDPTVEYKIDEVPNVDDAYPLVFDADSSQHSAIIDALDGKSLVIEGPPGTGKSQTITNLIAGSLAAGKTVLFVAEKMAALEVVKDRLDKAGLGEFCLELHGHKSQKAQVLQGLGSRLHQTFSVPSQIKKEKKLLEKYRTVLNEHADRINSHWKRTETSCHDILAGATRYKIEADWDPLPKITGINGDALTPLLQEELISNTRRLASLHAAVAKQTPGDRINSHYWYGVRALSLLLNGDDEFVATLRLWTTSLEAVCEALQSLSRRFGLTPEAISLDDFRLLCLTAASFGEFTGNERFERVVGLARDLEPIQECLQRHGELLKGWEALLTSFTSSALEGAAECEPNLESIRSLLELGSKPSCSLDRLDRLAKATRNLERTLVGVAKAFAEIRSNLPAELHACLATTPEGLGEFQTLVSTAEALPSELWRHRDSMFDEPELDGVLDELRVRLSPLVQLRVQLKEVYALGSVPTSVDVEADRRRLEDGGMFRWLSPSWRAARRRVHGWSLGDKASRKQSTRQLPRLLQYLKGLEGADELNSSSALLGERYEGVDTPVSRLIEVREWYRRVREEYGSGFDPRSPIGQCLLELPREFADGLVHYQKGALRAIVARAREAAAQLALEFSNSAIARDRSRSLVGEGGMLNELAVVLEVALARLVPSFTSNKLSLDEARSLFEKLRVQGEAVREWRQTEVGQQLDEWGFALTGTPADLLSTPFVALTDSLAVSRVLRESPLLLALVEKNPTETTCSAVQEFSGMQAELLDEEAIRREQFLKEGDVDGASWCEDCGVSVHAIKDRNGRALEHREWLSDWLSYLRIREQLVPQGLGDFIRRLEEQGLTEEQIETVTRASFLQQLAEEIVTETPELMDFYGPDQDSIRDQFRDYDKSVLSLKQREIAARVAQRDVPFGRSGGKVGELTELALVEHEVNKQRRHVALRDLLTRAGSAVCALKPCFMMSPMSVATHLQPGRHQFDLVVMDEASQIKPQDALGAIARGKSLIIVGDPKQLPPTSFFDRVADEDDSIEDEVALEQAESILDSVSAMFPTRRLRWHYRSRHESLIAFSAENFYDRDLVLFPSPFESSAEFGVKYHEVPDGFFKDQMNRPEARALVDALTQQLRETPQESVGVVAMSAKQRDLIEAEIEERQKSDPLVRRLFEKQAKLSEPVFLKNLETVQGDERDVIFISMTYGPQVPGGAVPQRFGPINRDAGWRRLNVLLTRSKKRMHIFSSMSASDITPGGREGKRALRNFLAFCERRPEAEAMETGRDPDSDFEVAVKRALEEHGYSCVSQLGVAGYFLDIAVRDPEDPGRFLVGIECDGATYHSAKSARDRDRLRQEVLESLGWKIVRIWSTDWFRNPQKQVQGVLNVLRSAGGEARVN